MDRSPAHSIVNALTGERMTFPPPETGDDIPLVFHCSLPPGVIGAPMHVHAGMTECFTCDSGILQIDLADGALRLLGPGETIRVEPGTPHGFRNTGPDEVRYHVTADPGRQLERFLRRRTGLMNDRRTFASGIPHNPLALAAVLNAMDMRLIGPPLWLQRILVPALAALARRLGVRADMA